jgi:hypothetical protein
MFELISHFSANEVNFTQNDLVLKNQLYFQEKKLNFLVPGGELIRQFKSGGYYILILFYDSIDYSSFIILVLDLNLQLLSTYSSPNFNHKKPVPYLKQFIETPDHKLSFQLGQDNPWSIEILTQPKILTREALVRISRGWWFTEELSRIIDRSYISVRPVK